MQSSMTVFLAGFGAGCLVCVAYIGFLKAKLASYRLFVSRRLDAQIANLLNRPPSEDGPSRDDGGPGQKPRPTPPSGPTVSAEGLNRLSSLVRLPPLSAQEPAKQGQH